MRNNPGTLFSSAIISSRKTGSNFLLINVGRGLSPGLMSSSSKSSADVNPYPNLPSSKKPAANAGESSLSTRSAANTGRWQEKLFGQPHGLAVSILLSLFDTT